MTPPPSSSRAPIDEDDQLDALVPMEEDDELVGTGEEEGVDQEGADADSSDDQDAEDLIDDDELDEDIGDGDGEDADGLDVGEDELDEDPFGRSEDDEASGRDGADAEGIAILDADERAGDLGEEGLDADGMEDEMAGRALPPMDGDDDERAPPLEERDIARRTSALLPWEDAAWSLRDLDTPKARLSVVRCDHGAVTAGGDALLEIAPGARAAFARPIPGSGGAVVALASLGEKERVFARASGAVSRLGERDVSPLPSCGDGHIVKMTATSGDSPATFALTDEGELFRLSGDHAAWKSLPCPTVQAIAGNGGELVALTIVEREPSIAISSNQGRTWTSRAIEEAVDITMVTELCATGDAVAMVGGGVWVLRGPRGTFEAPDGCEDTIAATFAGTGSDAPLVVLLSRDDGLFVARVGADLTVRLVADITSAGGDVPLGAAHLAWDETRGVVFLACGWGLFALGPPTRSST